MVTICNHSQYFTHCVSKNLKKLHLEHKCNAMRNRTLSLNSRILISTLIGTLAFAPAASFAMPQGPQNRGVQLHVSLGIPHEGYLDRYNSVLDLKNRSVEASLYVLRNVMIEGLLKHRQGLRELIGSEAQLKKALDRHANKSRLSFGVPRTVQNLYLVPGKSHREVIGIADRIRDLHNDSGHRFDRRQWQVFAAGLASWATVLTNMDRVLNFWTKDYWRDREVAAQFYSQVVAPYRRQFGSDPIGNRSINFTAEARKIWMRGQAMEDEFAKIAGTREAVMNMYPILSADVDGKPLYQAIYAGLVAGMGAPSASKPLVPVSKKLPPKGKPIPIPDWELGQAQLLGQKLYAAAVTNDAGGRSLLNLALSRINGPIEQGLIASLEANTNWLHRLASEVRYDRNPEDSELFKLAANDWMWPQAKERYSYLSDLINFDRAKSYIRHKQSQIDRNRAIRERNVQIVTGVMGGLLLALGAATTLGVGVPTAGLLAAETLDVAGLLIFTGAEVYQYARRQKVAEAARSMFLGNFVNSGLTHAEARGSVLVAASDFKWMLAWGLAAALRIQGVHAFKGVKKVVKVGGRRMVVLSKAEYAQLRGAYAQISSRGTRALVPMSRATISRVKEALGIRTRQERLVTIEQAIQEIAIQAKKPVPVVIERLKRYPLLGNTSVAFWKQMVTTEKFVQTLVTEFLVGFTLDSVADFAGRGIPTTWDEFVDYPWGSYAIHVGVGAAVNVAIVWKLADIKIVANPTWRDHVRHYDQLFRANATGYFTVGFVSGAAINGMSHVAEYLNDPGAMSAKDRAAATAMDGMYWGTYLGLSSAARYAGVVKMRDNFFPKVISNPTGQKVAYGMLSTVNGTSGSVMWIKGAILLGLEESAQQDLIGSGLTDEQWIRVAPPENTVAEMFDFMDTSSVAVALRR